MIKKIYFLCLLVLLFFFAGCQTPSNESKDPLNGNTLFNDGLLLVSNGTLFGYVNTKFELIIDYEYDLALPFMDERAIVIKNNEYYLIDLQGNKINSLAYDNLIYYPEHEFFVAEKGNLYGVIDKNDVTVIDFVFEGGLNFANGLAPFWVEIGYGYVSWDSKSNISVQFQSAHPFEDGFASVRNNYLYGLINTSGTLVVPYIYDEPVFADKNERIILHEMNPVTQTKQYRIVDFNQNEIFPFYHSITYVNGFYLVTEMNNRIRKDRIYDKNHQLVINQEFSSCIVENSDILCRNYINDETIDVTVFKEDLTISHEITGVSWDFLSAFHRVIHNLNGVTYLVFANRYIGRTLLYEPNKKMTEVSDEVTQIIDDLLVARNIDFISSVRNINNEIILQGTSNKTSYVLFADYYILELTHIENDNYLYKIFDWTGKKLYEFTSKPNW